MKSKWFQYSVYALSLVISLGLELWHPDVRDVLCTPLPIHRNDNLDSSPTIDRPQSHQPSLDREK